MGRVVDQPVRAAAAAGPVSGALCGSVASSLAEQSESLMERAVGAPLLPAEARQARGFFGCSDIVHFT